MIAASGRLDRREAVQALLRDRGELLVVSGLGAPTYDVFAAGDSGANFYLWGAMGSAATVGLGLALARPERPVAVITGDGELLMGLGALATIGVQGPVNLSVVVLDNERYGETGMQPSHTARGIDLAQVAKACGFKDAVTVEATDGLAALADRLGRRRGPLLAVVKVAAVEVPRALPPRDGPYLKTRFRQTVLGTAP